MFIHFILCFRYIPVGSSQIIVSMTIMITTLATQQLFTFCHSNTQQPRGTVSNQSPVSSKQQNQDRGIWKKIKWFIVDGVTTSLIVILLFVTVQPLVVFGGEFEFGLNVKPSCHEKDTYIPESCIKLRGQESSNRLETTTKSETDFNMELLYNIWLTNQSASEESPTFEETIAIDMENEILVNEAKCKEQTRNFISQLLDLGNITGSDHSWLGYLTAIVSGLVATSRIFLLKYLLQNNSCLILNFYVSLFVTVFAGAGAIITTNEISLPVTWSCISILIGHCISAAIMSSALFLAVKYMPASDYAITSSIVTVFIFLLNLTVLRFFGSVTTNAVVVIGTCLLASLAIGRPVLLFELNR